MTTLETTNDTSGREAAPMSPDTSRVVPAIGTLSVSEALLAGVSNARIPRAPSVEELVYSD